MNLVVQQTQTLQGQVMPPSSKSQSIRGLFLALLAKGETTLRNVLASDDANHALAVCRALGASMTASQQTFSIQSPGLPIHPTTSTIYTGNSGITTRFILPMLGLRGPSAPVITVDCGAQMRNRLIKSLVNALRNLGMNIDYLQIEGSLPLAVSGELKGGKTEVDGITSQYISALLLSLPCAKTASEITVKQLHERPYMEMTLEWLDAANIQYQHTRTQEEDIFHIPGNQHYDAFTKTIAGDFSSASYFLAAASMFAGEVEIIGLDMQDAQGDKRLVSILQAMGAHITLESTRLLLRGGAPLQGIKIDANDIPDLLPTLAVLGTYAAGKTEICNVKQARFKETDRIHSMTEGLRRMGATIEEHEDGMVIYQSQLQGAKVKGYDDHRTVMALALAGLLATGETWIDEAEAINKTFPTFVKLMQSLGARMEMQDAH